MLPMPFAAVCGTDFAGADFAATHFDCFASYVRPDEQGRFFAGALAVVAAVLAAFVCDPVTTGLAAAFLFTTVGAATVALLLSLAGGATIVVLSLGVTGLVRINGGTIASLGWDGDAAGCSAGAT